MRGLNCRPAMTLPLEAGHRGTHLARLSLTVLLLAAGAGCTSWSRLHQSAPVPTKGTIEVWRGGQAVLLRNPRMLGDSLVGQQVPPDTTRQALALSMIDSVRVQDIDMGKSLIVGTGVAVALLLVHAQGASGLQD
jgi:hypothetical protein